MSKTVEMILNGTVCEECNEYIDGESVGYLRLCSACDKQGEIFKLKIYQEIMDKLIDVMNEGINNPILDPQAVLDMKSTITQYFISANLLSIFETVKLLEKSSEDKIKFIIDDFFNHAKNYVLHKAKKEGLIKD